MIAFSRPVRLMVRPFRGYAALASAGEGPGSPTVLAGILRFLFVFGAFVSLTATGRLAPNELVSGMISFAYVPVVHAIALTAAIHAMARNVRVGRAFALFAEGYAPWLLFMWLVAGGSLFAPSPARLLSGSSVWLILGAQLWGGVLTFACFRSGLGLTRRRAAAATAIHYFTYTSLIVGYYVAAGQLLPIIPR